MFSAKEHPEVISKYISYEVALWRVHGPYKNPVGIHASPIGVIPKKHQPGRWRLICDLSSPEGASVNDGINSDMCSLHYISVQDAIDEVHKQGHAAQLAKIDIKDAYCILPVHPNDRHVLGFQWQGLTYIDGVLPFGLRSTPKIFNTVTDLLQWILVDRCQIFIVHYSDDFLLVGPPNSPKCQTALEITLQTCALPGYPNSPRKSRRSHYNADIPWDPNRHCVMESQPPPTQTSSDS